MRLLQERYNRFSGVVQRYKENFPVDFKHFQAIFSPLREKFSRWNYRKIAERNQYTATFNIEAWNKPPQMQVNMHFKIASNVSLNIVTCKFYFLSNARDLPVQ